jgi:Rtf2 RING-finger
MGGDGGTKAVQRAYLRGAGAASTTGDGRRLLSSSSSNSTTITRCDPQVQQQEALRAMRYCYISDQPLQFETDTPTITAAASSSSIVTCRLGRLYNKVAVIEALLERKQRLRSSASTQPGGMDDVKEGRLGGHIRGLKDIYDVRFHTVANTATSTATATATSTATATTGQIPHCPITGRELNGMVTAYALCIPGNNLPRNNNSCNVVSEYAIQQLTEAAIMTEYGATMKIRLLPPTSALPDIHRAIALERNNKESLLLHRDKKKILKKKRDKRKRTDEEASLS